MGLAFFDETHITFPLLKLYTHDYSIYKFSRTEKQGFFRLCVFQEELLEEPLIPALLKMKSLYLDYFSMCNTIDIHANYLQESRMLKKTIVREAGARVNKTEGSENGNMYIARMRSNLEAINQSFI